MTSAEKENRLSALAAYLFENCLVSVVLNLDGCYWLCRQRSTEEAGRKRVFGRPLGTPKMPLSALEEELRKLVQEY